jgi:hypothetical protein
LLISLFLCVENRHRVEPSAKETHAA